MKFLVVSAVFGAAAASQAFTVATFADPALDGSTPLFTWTPTAISGSWTGTGLTLQTPGWAGPDITDAKMSMSPVSLVALGGGLYAAGAGVIHFTDAASLPVLDVTFGSGFLSIFGLGATDFVGNAVSFSGPGVPSGWVSNSFSFAFANQSLGATSTATSSFTSSAVPEPASLLAVGLGVVALAARRRRK